MKIKLTSKQYLLNNGINSSIMWPRSSTWIKHLASDQETAGSNPVGAVYEAGYKKGI